MRCPRKLPRCGDGGLGVRDLEENHVRDGDAERPVLSEMAEKLRQARGSGFHDAEPEDAADAPPRAAAPPPAAAPPRARARGARGTTTRTRESGSLQASLRLDSIERRLFDLRATLDELAAEHTDMLLATGRAAPTDAEAWIAFAAAAIPGDGDAAGKAEIADRLLAEYRRRRESGGVLSGED